MTDRVSIADSIIAAIGSSDDAIEQMQSILENLDRAGYKIVPKSDTEQMLERIKLRS